MTQIAQNSLMSLEAYAKGRKAFRERVMMHKQARTAHLGANMTLLFEDELTIRYQVQEMLRIERIFEEAGIRQELEAYNPLIPDGSNWKATMLIEFVDPAERQRRLAELIGVEDRVWVRVQGHGAVFAIADEDLDRETAEKTSSVHFLRFELSTAMCDALRAGAALSIGVDHPNYRAELDPVPDPLRAALLVDLA